MDYANRKGLRLPGYDYSRAGGYFITVCTHKRSCILSRVLSGNENRRSQIELTNLGRIAEEVLLQLEKQYNILVPSWVIMPNHIHLILVIENSGGKTRVSAGQFVGAFKSIVFNQWKKECDRCGMASGKLWQRDFYDHIIRNEADFLEKLKYIDENPDKWSMDNLYISEIVG